MRIEAKLLPKMYMYLLFLAAVFYGSKSVYAENGTFWHVTDIHVDKNYSRTGNKKHFCWETAGQQSNGDLGRFGNFFCDTPEILLTVTVNSMSEIEPHPDFIIWTGDNLPHVWDPHPNWTEIYEGLEEITTLLKNAFPGVAIYPSIGNHDSFPPNILIPQNINDSMYADYLMKGRWKDVIPESSWPTFLRGGYYSATIMPGLQLISLNTILWYETNRNVTHMTDPADQFEWLENVLKNASSIKEKVYIIGHIPPGFYNKVALPLSSHKPFMYHPRFLTKYLSVTEKYSDTIAGQFFGHLHLDTFQLFQYNTGVTHSSSLLASSVTPWHSPALNGLSLPVNPSIRLMHFEKSNGSLIDYDQHFLNLTKANKKPDVVPSYELLYSFTEAYGVPDVSTASLYKVYEKLKSDDTMFSLFNHYMTAGQDSVPCGNQCKTAELCAIICTSLEEYFPCMQPSGGIVITSHTTLYVILGVLVVLLVVTSLVAFYRLRKKGSRSQRQYEQFNEF